MADQRITVGPCGDLAQIPNVEIRRVDTTAGPMVEIAMTSAAYCWRVRSWWPPEQARRFATQLLEASDPASPGVAQPHKEPRR